MAMSMFLLVFGALVSTVSGDVCCQPPVYEVGYNALVSEEFDDGPLVYTWESQGATNREGQITASIQTISYDNGTIETTRTIADYKNGVLYSINGLNCVKAKLGGTISEGCAPDFAKYDGTDRAAFSQIPLEVGTWSWWDPEDNGNYLVGNISVTYLLYDCRPVQEMFFGRSKYNGKYYYTTVSGTFQNYVYGIMNPNKYFTVPPFCPKEFSSEAPDWLVRLDSAHSHRPFSIIDFLHRDSRDLSTWPIIVTFN